MSLIVDPGRLPDQPAYVPNPPAGLPEPRPAAGARWWHRLRPTMTLAARTTVPVRSRRAGSRFSWAGQNCSILYIDIAGFGSHDRDDRDRGAIRAAMYHILRSAFHAAGLPWHGLYYEDRGDGVLLVIPPSIPTSTIVEPLLGYLAGGLCRHNRTAAGPTRIQLRAALHVGPVTPDDEGICGESIIYTARLLDAPVLKAKLAATGADLAFIASTFVYDTVVRHRPGAVDPADYQAVELTVKESSMAAWVYLAAAGGDGEPRPVVNTR